MTTGHEKPMPWEDEANDLTEAEVKEQLARMLATGALQAVQHPPRSAKSGAEEGSG